MENTELMELQRRLHDSHESADNLRARIAELVDENARLRDALECIESIFVDGSDTYEDWKAMGGIARDILANTSKS